MPPVLFDSFEARLAHLAVTKRIRVPSFETILLCCRWVAHTFCAVRLENHSLEGASCGRHRADMSLVEQGAEKRQSSWNRSLGSHNVWYRT